MNSLWPILALAVVALSLVPAAHEAIRRRRAATAKPPLRTVPIETAFSELERAAEQASEHPSEPHPTVFSIDPSLPVTFAVPTFPREGTTQRAVADEDLIAMTRMIREMGPLEVRREHADRVEVPFRSHLVLICSPRRNEALRELLRRRDVKQLLDSEFAEVVESQSHDVRFGISFGERTYMSPLFIQEQALRQDPTADVGPFADYGMIARFPNPWNARAKIFVAAGVRGLGTIGAAEYLCDHARELFIECGGEDFVAVVRAEQDELHKPPVRTTREVLRVLEPPEDDWPDPGEEDL